MIVVAVIPSATADGEADADLPRPAEELGR